MAFGVGVGQSEVIHHIWQHRPELNTHRHAELSEGASGHQSVVFGGFSAAAAAACVFCLLFNDHHS